MVTLMVTNGSVDQSPIYKSDLWPFISETPECCPRYLSVGIRLFQDSPGRFRWFCGYQIRESQEMMMMYHFVPFISEPQVGFVVTYSLRWLWSVQRSGLQCNSCSDDLEDGTVHCIHASAPSTFCIHRHLTHVYPYSGYILDWDSGWERSWCQNVIVKLLSVSMKSESKDRVFLIRIDIAFMCESY